MADNPDELIYLASWWHNDRSDLRHYLWLSIEEDCSASESSKYIKIEPSVYPDEKDYGPSADSMSGTVHNWNLIPSQRKSRQSA